jgi:alkylated DNA repair dioxygenase AlkB
MKTLKLGSNGIKLLNELSERKKELEKEVKEKIKLIRNMKPEYYKNFIENGFYEKLVSEVPWANRDAPRDECFMSLKPLEYTYGKGFTRTYISITMTETVKKIMDLVNKTYNTEYDICFLNFYKSEKEHLGWHADDSPEMDENHPIGVISFGADRYIWVKLNGVTGNIPDEDKYLLEDGSLFVMPAGFQNYYLHKIPKNDKPCGGRISLTFRKYKN